MALDAPQATFDYILRLNAIRQNIVASPKRAEPSWVRITTITMCSKFLQEIDLKKFRENFEKIGSIIVRRAGSKFRGFEWKMKETAFYNQVTIGYQDAYSRKSIKLFPNGSIQVAGCSDLFDCRRILRQLSFILRSVMGLDANIPMGDISVKMINTNFSLNSSVNLKMVIDSFAKSRRCAFKVTFDPDRYSAVKVKFSPGEGMKQVTASIFRTGRIIVTGAQTLTEIAESYGIINEVIKNEVLVQDVETPEMFETIMGAKFDEWVRVLNKM
jgi:TATA-box binding protein (TBP) (component of TFIID and TFIIIB)